MIRLSGLANLQALKEQDEPKKEPETNSGEEVPMIQKLTKLKSMKLSPEQEKKVDEMLAKVQELTGNQKKLDVDGDGKIEADDLAKLRAGKTDEAWGDPSNVEYRAKLQKDRDAHFGRTPKPQPARKPRTGGDNPKITNPKTGEKIYVHTAISAGPSHPAYSAARAYLGIKEEAVSEGADHEVSMGAGLLDDIIKNATELKEKMGQDEKDVPAWIQDHISQAQNFINQANTNYHEHEKPEDTAHPEMDDKELNEEAPAGWEKTIKAMKKKKDIDNPWALANWMKKKGYTPKKENISELSPRTLDSYLDKAVDDREDSYDVYSDPSTKVGDATRKYAKQRVKKRTKGINTAVKKIGATRKTGEKWTTPGGAQATKNADGTISYTKK